MKRWLNAACVGWDRALDIRFEDGAWPRWRIDKSVRYTIKSYVHDRGVADPHFARASRYLQQVMQDRGRESAANAPRVKLCLAGDWMWRPWQSRNKTGLSTALAAYLARADLRIFNLETPLADAPVPNHAIVRFNADPSLLRAWPAPTVVSIVNNHALDHGIAGLEATRRAVEGAGLHCVGGPLWPHATTKLTVNGIRIGVVGCTFGVNPWWCDADAKQIKGLPHAPLGAERASVDWDLVQGLLASIADCDLRIVVPHWGYEFSYWPSARLRQDAYRLVELGADIIAGSSQHVLQPLELVSVDGWDECAPTQLKRGGGPRPALIAFSLGNFVSSMPTDACRTGVVVELEAAKTQGGLSLQVRDARGTWSERGSLARSGQTALLSECAPEVQSRATPHVDRALSAAANKRSNSSV